MKITVVGAGIMGLSVAWALQRDGHQVIVYEQGQIPNCLGSSVDQHRLIRFPYGDQLGYTRMVSDAYQAWDQLWIDLGKRLYVKTGTLVLTGAEKNESWAYSSAVTLQKLGLSMCWFNNNQLKDNFPLFLFDDIRNALYLDSGGVLLASKIIEALLWHLGNRGVIFHARVRVNKVNTNRARIILEDRKIVDADILIITAGPWVSRLLPKFVQRVTPSRQTVLYIEPPNLLATKWNSTPMIIDDDQSNGFYVVPNVLDTQIKIGSNSFTMAGDPDSERTVSRDEIFAIRKLCQRRFKNFNQYHFKGANTCFYTVTPQRSFIIESKNSSWIMSGFSGHGFKFGPLLGLALAETIRGCRNKDELSKWAAGEFN